jgi:hypothetical protein
MLGPSSVLEESHSRSGFACCGTTTLCHAAKWFVEGNGESSVTVDKVLKVVAGVWMN